MTLARGHITILNIKDGKPGEDGAPALTLVLTPAQLVFDADTDGIVTPGSLSANTATVQIAKGSTMVAPSTATIKGVGCTATYTAGTIRVTAIDKDERSSLPAGYIDVTATYDGSTFTSRLYWSVNIHRVVANIEKKATTIEQSVNSINVKMENGKLTKKETEAIIKLTEGKVKILVQGLKDAGIDVETGAVTLYGDKVSVENEGKQVVLIKDGKLNSEVIDAKKIVAEGDKAQGIDAKDATFKNVNVEGSVKADSGYVGGFQIRGKVLLGNTDDKDRYMPGIVVKDDKGGKLVQIGSTREEHRYYTFPVLKVENIREPYNLDNGNNVALYLSAEGSNEIDYENSNVALFIPKGTIKGFRLKMKRVNASSYYIDKNDTFLVNRADSADWYLPSDCEDGQSFYIVPSRSCTVTIHTAEGDRLSYERGDTSRNLDGAYIHQFVYDAENHYWYWGWQN